MDETDARARARAVIDATGGVEMKVTPRAGRVRDVSPDAPAGYVRIT